jgi:hypothetical protein
VDPQITRAVTTAQGDVRFPAGRVDEHVRRFWLIEVWLSFRPYFIALTIDFLVFVMLWFGLRGACALAIRLSLPGSLPGFLTTSHGIAVVASFVFVSSLALYDIREIHGRHR